MARIEESIEIRCPVDKVFAYTTDPEKWSKWLSFIPEAEQTSRGTMNTGSTYRGISRMMGRNMKWSGIVTEYEPDRKWNKDISSEGLVIKESVTYNPVDGGTTFTLMYDLSAGGFLKLLLPVIAGSMRKEARKSLENLKNILEKKIQ